MEVSPQHLGEVPRDHVVHDAHDLAVNLLTMVTEVLGEERQRIESETDEGGGRRREKYSAFALSTTATM